MKLNTLIQSKYSEALILGITIMAAQNPKMEKSHELCDWVIENYIDHVRAINKDISTELILGYWIKYNSYDFNQYFIILSREP